MPETEPKWTQIRQAMLDRIGELIKSETSVAKTNFGGRQSSDDLSRFPEFAWLPERLFHYSNEIAPSDAPDLGFDNGILWANVNDRFNFSSVQAHADSLMSGALYLSVSREDQGVIQFFDAREGAPASRWRSFIQLSGDTELTLGVVSVAPREGDIFFFPGWVKHWVTPNLTDELRVSVSFNLRTS